jgi:hypothetical protein
MALTAIGFAASTRRTEPVGPTQKIQKISTFLVIFVGGAVIFTASFIEGVSNFNLVLQAWVIELFCVFLGPLVVFLIFLWLKPKNDDHFS